MYFALLTFFAAFSIEVIGTVVSVIGLSTLFGANPIIMTLAVLLTSASWWSSLCSTSTGVSSTG